MIKTIIMADDDIMKMHYKKSVIIGGDQVDHMACSNIFTRGAITDDPERVDCKRCIKIIKKQKII